MKNKKIAILGRRFCGVRIILKLCLVLVVTGLTSLALVVHADDLSIPVPVLTSDKADYEPGETVSLFGRLFEPFEGIVVRLFGGNQEDGNFMELKNDLVADEGGAFTTLFTLNDDYRPLLTAIAENSAGEERVRLTVTDGLPVDFSQCANNNPTAGSCDWIGSILQQSNSIYYEGMTVPQRILYRGLNTGGIHTISFTYAYTKNGVHAYDFLTTVNPQAGYAQGNTGSIPGTTVLNPCGNLSGPNLTSCNNLNPGINTPTVVTIPSDTYDSKDTGPTLPGTGSTQSTKETTFTSTFPGVRGVTVYSTTPSAFSNPSLTLVHNPVADNTDTGDSEVLVTLTFTSAGCTNSSKCDYLLYFGGHLAVSGNNQAGVNWGPSLGASAINGGPYHIKNLKFDGNGGSQDNQIQSADILPSLPEPTLTVIKQVINDNGGTLGVSDFPLFVDATTAVVSGATTTVSAGIHTVSETGQLGYAQTSITGDCDPNGNVTLVAGENKTCIITNDDIPPRLTVIKHVINDDFGIKSDGDFTMIISGAVTASTSSINFSGSEAGVTTILPYIGSYLVTESGAEGYKATYSSGCTGTLGLGESNTCTITNDDLPGRMTGGGSVFTARTGDIPAGGVRVTHGFTLHCRDLDLKNNLEINWNDKSGVAQKFHLEKLTSAVCVRDPNVSPAPPKSSALGFNQFIGEGIGRYNGVPGANIKFKLSDVGEPGKNDTATYQITVDNGTVLSLVAPKKLEVGNHQAHRY